VTSWGAEHRSFYMSTMSAVVPSSAPDWGHWAATLERITLHFGHTKTLPYAHTTPMRVCRFAAMPMCCSICLVWSATWRLVLCPFMCCQHGLGYMCSDNGCTTLTDACIVSCAEEANRPVRLWVPTKPIADASNTELLAVTKAVKMLGDMLGRQDIKRQYVLAEATFPYVNCIGAADVYGHLPAYADEIMGAATLKLRREAELRSLKGV
jgi:hypothetical protein